MLAIFGLLAKALGVVQALLGMKRDAAIRQGGIDAQRLADADTAVTTLKAEQQAAAGGEDAAADLKAGRF